MSPSIERDKKAVKLKPRRNGDSAPTEAKTYNLPLPVIMQIRDVASLYGSQGRAIQVGSELLVRLPKPLPIAEPAPDSIKRKTYKLNPRTIEIIQELSKNGYGDESRVLMACMKILKVKKLDSSYLSAK